MGRCAQGWPAAGAARTEATEVTEATAVAAQVAMGSGSGERGAQGGRRRRRAGGRPETAQPGSSPLAREVPAALARRAV